MLCIAIPPVALITSVIALVRKQSIPFAIAGSVLSAVPTLFFLVGIVGTAVC
jgi:hypothetical protein